MSKPVLFTYPLSVWASAPELAIRELGYAPDDIQKKVVDLLQGDNFAPAFLDTNAKGTLPTLAADGISYTSTAEVTSYLVKHAPKSAKPGTSFIAKIHQDKYDPNFPLLLSVSVDSFGVQQKWIRFQRSDKELEHKTATFVMDFVRNRQDALGRYASQSDAAQHKAFYHSKTTSNGSVLSIYHGTASHNDKQAFFEQSTTHWNNLKQFIYEELATILPDTAFLGGDTPGEDDFHLAAWLARIAFVAGNGKEQDGVRALENDFGTELPAKVSAYWGAWSSRKSWQEVYAEGLH